MIEIKDLKKSFNGTPVLTGVTTSIEKGEVVAVIGRSGSGKSTLLRSINQLETPDSGSVVIDGIDMMSPGTDIPTIRQKMNMVFQGFNLFDHLNVLDNLTLAPTRLGVRDASSARARAIELLRVVGLSDKTSHYPSQLSGGQRQRVAIARCLAMDPEVILFDEPTSALDPTNVGEVLSVVRQLAADGMTMIIVTHELDFARDVANRILFMDEGVIYEEGPPSVIFEAPAHARTREFIKQSKSLCFTTTAATPDLHGLHGAISMFCQANGLDRTKSCDLELVSEELLQIIAHDSSVTGKVSIAVDYFSTRNTVSLELRLPDGALNPLEAGPEAKLPLKLIRSLSTDIQLAEHKGRREVVVRMR